MTDAPLVSIIIPVYNGSDYLKEAIESALAQTYSNIEILVVNDGSCDDGKTEEIALSYKDRIRYITKPNGGVSSALNLGIAQMKGELFSWLSHDDKYTETKVENQVGLLRKYRDEKVIALCGSRFIDKSSMLMPQGNKKRFESEYIECDKALEDLYGRGTYNGCAFLIPKKYFDECGGFDEDLRFAQDTLMWTKLLLSGCSIVYNGDVGVLSRVHANQQTNKSRHLLEHDSKKIADYIVPFLKERNRTSLFLFAKRNAKLSNYGAVQTCIEKGEITGKQKASLSLFLLYGKIRPTIRKVYYRIFKNIKTR